MAREINPAVYIMANRRNGTLYTGVTSDLPQRVWQHREGIVDGFSKRYGCKMLAWFEQPERWNRRFCVKSRSRQGAGRKSSH